MPVAAGTRLGPYEVVDFLGAGGMGEVYRARDPRLGRDVALKVLHDDVATDPTRLKRFELEARAVAALNHPHILTVHDVGTHAGTPYVVCELLEGQSLREVLTRSSATQRQVLAWAVQVAQGLAAAHRKGIVHRDLKPENLFLTTDGRIKILDFGLAKQSTTAIDREGLTASNATKPGAMIGTVAYMSPEQVQALPVDARSDLFSFGVVLYELLSGVHPFRRETEAATLAAILKQTPLPLVSVDPAIPRAVDGIVGRCLEKRPEERFQGAHDLGLALEAVLQAPAGSAALEELEERSPYPGLAAYTEKDAPVFFGREAEVRALWERIRSRRLLAVIGASGVGKTSFLRAGVMAARPEGWGAVHATPGSNPGLGLARALTPDLATDAEAIGALLMGIAELSQTGDAERVVGAARRWRSRRAEALLVMDQFEELFALNTTQTQARFASLLRRLTTDADVHVVLSMRDDFLIRCSDHEPLASVFSEITPLTALNREGLRRAVTEPAKKRGYRFEDDALVDEVVSSVEGVRGALPLLAFAVARLWERRDRERKVLTRDASREIGGVEGALARHAEATMDRLGPERQSVVRELFRNLISGQGTRAVIDREELLSAFPDRPTAEGVLRELVDARLLTTYEVEGRDGEPAHHRVEVAHESLLKAWPRLVRWQAQDEEGTVLRDQLRQAAHLWDEKGRTSDLLWTGTAYREYVLWRERYPGALTAIEEDFARSMADKARRKKRLVRLAAAAVFVAITAVALAIGISRQKAVDAALRSEASRVLALGELRLAEDPTEALALATASLELADSREARVFAMRTLSEAPPAMELVAGASVRAPAFSPDGRQLAAIGHSPDGRVWREDGRGPVVLSGHEPSQRGSLLPRWVSNDRLITGLCCTLAVRAHVWAVPEGRPAGVLDFGAPSDWVVRGNSVLTDTPSGGPPEAPAEVRLRRWPLPGESATELGTVDWKPLGASARYFSPDGASWLYAKASTLYARALPLAAGAADRPVGSQSTRIVEISPDRARADALLTSDAAAELRLAGALRRWTLVAGEKARVEDVPKPTTAAHPVEPDASDRWLVDGTMTDNRVLVWRRGAWPAARPLELRRSGTWTVTAWTTHPSGDRLVASTAGATNLTFWPLGKPYPTIVDGYAHSVRPLAFSPDSRWLATSWEGRLLRLWPIAPDATTPPLPLGVSEANQWWGFAFDPGGRHLFAVGNWGRTWIVPLSGEPARRLHGFPEDTVLQAAGISPSGRYVATAVGWGRAEKMLRVFDLETGDVRVFDLPQPKAPGGSSKPAWAGFEGGILSLGFAGESTLYTSGHGGVRRWDLTSGKQETVIEIPPDQTADMRIQPEKGLAVTLQGHLGRPDECAPVVAHDLATRSSWPLPAFGSCVQWFDLDASGGVLATGDKDGIVRVGRLSASEPHLLVGHKGVIDRVAISPDLRLVASTGGDNTLRVWPTPDLDKPPLHTLPRAELVAKLKSLTNLRAVRDPKSATDWTIETGPFPGWKNVPTW